MTTKQTSDVFVRSNGKLARFEDAFKVFPQKVQKEPGGPIVETGRMCVYQLLSIYGVFGDEWRGWWWVALDYFDTGLGEEKFTGSLPVMT